MADFFHMGGYAIFVWTAYGLAAGALILLAVTSIRGARKTRERVEALRPRRRKGE